jgi:hypothetical protein
VTALADACAAAEEEAAEIVENCEETLLAVNPENVAMPMPVLTYSLRHV